jgi:deoxyinosine 3'endonuclease (endonuclease V)
MTGFLHAWEVSPQEAIAIQEQLRHAVELEDRFGSLQRVAAIELALRCTGRFRIPEPTRQAHRLASGSH